MEFHLSEAIQEKGTRARSGVLKFPPPYGSHTERAIKTPALVAHTSGGSTTYLTHDLVEEVGLKALHLSYGDLEATAVNRKFKPFEGGIHEGLCLFPDLVGIMSPTPLLQGSLETSSSTHLTVTAAHSRKTVTPQQYIDVAKTIRPDILLVLHDEVSGKSGKKRHVKAWNRTLSWLNTCAAALGRGDGVNSTPCSSRGGLRNSNGSDWGSKGGG
ncbi:unnamed protein product, partial [Discosporangium mesarthrocarpum]